MQAGAAQAIRGLSDDLGGYAATARACGRAARGRCAAGTGEHAEGRGVRLVPSLGLRELLQALGGDLCARAEAERARRSRGWRTIVLPSSSGQA